MIIETSLSPADHLEPLNEEAEAAMEKYYSKEVVVLDPETGEPKRKFYPNKDKRPSVREAVEPHTLRLVDKEEFNEAPLVGVTQERILANDTAGPIELEKDTSKVSAINVDDFDAAVLKKKAS